MARYGYEHVAEEASRYLDVHDFFRAHGATPTHKPEVSSSTLVPLQAIGWIEVKEIGEAPIPRMIPGDHPSKFYPCGCGRWEDSEFCPDCHPAQD